MIIGQYRCGCSYGPMRKKDRLEYCGIHGAEIQKEYVTRRKRKNEKKTPKPIPVS